MGHHIFWWWELLGGHFYQLTSQTEYVMWQVYDMWQNTLAQYRVNVMSSQTARV